MDPRNSHRQSKLPELYKKPLVSRIMQPSVMSSPTSQSIIERLKSTVEEMIDFKATEQGLLNNTVMTQTELDFDQRSLQDATTLLSDAQAKIALISNEKSLLGNELKASLESLEGVKKDMGLKLFRLQQELDKKNVEISNLRKDKDDYECNEKMLKLKYQKRIEELSQSLDDARAVTDHLCRCQTNSQTDSSAEDQKQLEKQIKMLHTQIADDNLKRNNLLEELVLLKEELEITRNLLQIQTQRGDELSDALADSANDWGDVSALLTEISSDIHSWDLTPHFDLTDVADGPDYSLEVSSYVVENNLLKSKMETLSNENIKLQNELEEINLLIKKNENQFPTFCKVENDVVCFADVKQESQEVETSIRVNMAEESCHTDGNYHVKDDSVSFQTFLTANTSFPNIENVCTVPREHSNDLETFAKEFSKYLTENEVFHPEDVPPSDIEVFNFLLDHYLELVQTLHTTKEYITALEQQQNETKNQVAMLSQLETIFDVSDNSITASSVDFDPELRSPTVCEPKTEISFSTTVVGDLTHDPLELTRDYQATPLHQTSVHLSSNTPLFETSMHLSNATPHRQTSAHRSTTTPLRNILRNDSCSTVKKSVKFQSPLLMRSLNLEAENVRLKNSLNEALASCLSVESCLQRKSTEVAELTTRISQLENATKEFQILLEKMEMEGMQVKESLEADLAEKLSVLETIRSKLISESVNLDASLEEIVNAASHTEVITIFLNTIIAQCQKVQEQQKDDHRKERENWLSETFTLTTTNQALKEELRQLQFNLNEIKAMLQCVNDEKNKIEQQILALEESKTEMKIENKNFTDIIEALKQKLSDKEFKEIDLERNNVLLNEETQRCSKNLDIANSAIKELEAAKLECESILGKVEKEKFELEGKLKDLEKGSDELSAKTERLNQTIEDNKSAFNEQLMLLKSESEELKVELNNLKSTAESSVFASNTVLEENVNRLTSENVLLREQIQLLTSEIQNLKSIVSIEQLEKFTIIKNFDVVRLTYNDAVQDISAKQILLDEINMEKKESDRKLCCLDEKLRTLKQDLTAAEEKIQTLNEQIKSKDTKNIGVIAEIIEKLSMVARQLEVDAFYVEKIECDNLNEETPQTALDLIDKIAQVTEIFNKVSEQEKGELQEQLKEKDKSFLKLEKLLRQFEDDLRDKTNTQLQYEVDAKEMMELMKNRVETENVEYFTELSEKISKALDNLDNFSSIYFKCDQINEDSSLRPGVISRNKVLEKLFEAVEKLAQQRKTGEEVISDLNEKFGKASEELNQKTAALKSEIAEKRVVIAEKEADIHKLQEKNQQLSNELSNFFAQQSVTEAMLESKNRLEALLEDKTHSLEIKENELRLLVEEKESKEKEAAFKLAEKEREIEEMITTVTEKGADIRRQLQEKIDEISKDLNQEIAAKIALESEITEIKMTVDEKEAIILQIQENNNKVSEELTRETAAKFALESEIAEMKTTVDEKEAIILQIQEKNNKISEELTRETAAKFALESEIAEIKTAVDEKEAIILQIQEKNNKISEELTRETAAKFALESEIAEIKTAVDDKEAIILQLQEKNDKISDELTRETAAKIAFESKIGEMIAVIAEKEADIGQLQEKNDQLSNELSHFLTQQSVTEAMLESKNHLEALLAEKANSLQMKETALRSLENEKEYIEREFNSKLAEKETSVQVLRKSENELTSQISSAKEQLDLISANKEDIERELSSKIMEKDNIIQGLRDQETDLLTQLAQIKEGIEEKDSVIQRLRDHEVEFTSQIEKIHEANAGLRAEIEQLVERKRQIALNSENLAAQLAESKDKLETVLLSQAEKDNCSKGIALLLAEKDSIVQSLQGRMEELTQKLNQVEEEKMRFETDYANLFAEKNQVIADLNNKETELMSRIVQVEEKLESLRIEKQQFEGEAAFKLVEKDNIIESLQNRDIELSSEVEKTKEQLSLSKSEKDQLERETSVKLADQETIIERLHSRDVELTAQVAQSKEELALSKAEKDQIERETKTKLSEQDKIIEKLQNHIAELADQVKIIKEELHAATQLDLEATSKVSEQDKIIQDLRKREFELTTQIALVRQELNTEIETLNKKLSEVHRERKAIEADVEYLKKNIESLDERLDNANSKCCVAENLYMQEKDLNKKLTVELHTVEDQMNANLKKMVDVNKELECQIVFKNNLNHENEILKQNLAVAKVEISQLTDTVDRYKSTEKAILLRLEEKQKSDEMIIKLNDEIVSLNIQIKSLKKDAENHEKLILQVKSLNLEISQLKRDLDGKDKLLKSGRNDEMEENNKLLISKNLEILQLKKENEGIEVLKNELERKFLESNDEIKDVKKRMDDLLDENTSLCNQKSALHKEIEGLKKRNLLFKDKTTELETLGRMHKEQITELTNKLLTVESVMERRPRKSSEHISNRRLDRLEELNKALHDLLIHLLTLLKMPNISKLNLISLRGLENAKRLAVDYVTKIAESNVENLKQQMTDLDQENEELAEKCNALLEANNELELKIINMEKVTGSTSGGCCSCSETTKAVAARDDEITELKTVCAANNRKVEKLTCELKEFKDKCSSLEDTCTNLRASLNEKEQQLLRSINNIGVRVYDDSKDVNRQHDKIRSLTKTNDMLKGLLRESTQRIKLLEGKTTAPTALNSNQMDSPIRERGYNLRNRTDVAAAYKRAIRTKADGVENI